MKDTFNYRWVYGTIIALLINVILFLITLILPFNLIEYNIFGFKFGSDFFLSQPSYYYVITFALFGIYITVISIITGLSTTAPSGTAVEYIFEKLKHKFFISFVIMNCIFASIIVYLKPESGFTNLFLFLSYIVSFFLLIIVSYNLIKNIQFKPMTDAVFPKIEHTLDGWNNINISGSETFGLEKSGSIFLFTNKNRNAILEEKSVVESTANYLSIGTDYISVNYGFIEINPKIVKVLEKYKNHIISLRINTLTTFVNNPLEITISFEFKNLDDNARGTFKNEIKKYLNVKTIEKRDFERFVELFTYNHKQTSYFKYQYAFLKAANLVDKYNKEPHKIRFFFSLFYEIIDFVEENSVFDKAFREFIHNIQFKYQNNAQILIILQDVFHYKIISELKEQEKFSDEINTSGLYLNEFFKSLSYKFRDINVEETYNFEQLLSNTIDHQIRLCRFILDYDIPDRNKKVYFKNQLQYFITTLEYFYTDPYEYDSEYLNLDKNDEKKKLIDYKTDLIKKIQSIVDKEVISLLFTILSKIESHDLNKEFFDIALEINDLTYHHIKQFWSEPSIKPIDHMLFLDKLHAGGAQFIAPFNDAKYRLLLLFNRFARFGEFHLSKYDDNFFSKYSSYSFSAEADKLTEEFIIEYFTFKTAQLEEFKHLVKDETAKRVKLMEKSKTDYIANTPLNATNNKHIKQFKLDVETIWKEYQDQFKKILNYESKLKTTSASSFGQYVLREKEWFLDSYDPNLALDRSMGKEFGRNQVISKEKAIFEKINNTYNTHKDKQINVTNLVNDLKTIVKPGQEYFFFCDTKLSKEIYLLYQNITWLKEKLIRGILNINNAKIYFTFSHQDNISLLFTKESFNLVQYKCGYENIPEEIVIIFEDAFNDQEIAKLIKSDKNSIKSKEDIQQFIKIKVVEKFDIKRNSNAKLFRLMLKSDK